MREDVNLRSLAKRLGYGARIGTGVIVVLVVLAVVVAAAVLNYRFRLVTRSRRRR
jgi:hypothetical protein